MQVFCKSTASQVTRPNLHNTQTPARRCYLSKIYSILHNVESVQVFKYGSSIHNTNQQNLVFVFIYVKIQQKMPPIIDKICIQVSFSNMIIMNFAHMRDREESGFRC